MTLRNLSPNRPSVTFNFQRAKKLDPRITFTRASFAESGTPVPPGSGTGGSGGTLKTFNVDVPRLTDQGLLIEQSRTNIIPDSVSLGSFAKNGNGFVVDQIAPDGTTTAATYTQSATQGLRRNEASTNGNQTVSVFAKAGTGSILRLNIWDGDYGGAQFDLSNGTIVDGSVDPGWTAFDPVSYGNGWWRCAVHRNVVNATFTEAWIWETRATASGKSLILWGAQMEAGTFPTSYIPTTGAQVTRAADFCYIDGDNFSSWYGGSEGTFVTSTAGFNPTNTDKIIIEGWNTNFADFALQIIDYSPRFVTFFPDANGIVGPLTAFPINTRSIKLAGAYSSTEFAAATNGAPAEAGTGSLTPRGAATSMKIGARPTSEFLNGHISRIAYYPTRVPDSALQGSTYS